MSRSSRTLALVRLVFGRRSAIVDSCSMKRLLTVSLYSVGEDPNGTDTLEVAKQFWRSESPAGSPSRLRRRC